MVGRQQIASSASELRLVLARLTRRLRSEHPFSLSHATVLGRLERDGPQTTSALAAAEHVRPQSMAQTVAELESQGYITREDDPTDGRRTFIELTDAGAGRLADERKRRDGWLARAIAEELTPEEQDTLVAAVSLLGRLADRDRL